FRARGYGQGLAVGAEDRVIHAVIEITAGVPKGGNDLALAHVPQLDGTNDWSIVLDDIVGAGQDLAIGAEGDGCVLAGAGSFQRSKELDLWFGLACHDRR